MQAGGLLAAQPVMATIPRGKSGPAVTLADFEAGPDDRILPRSALFDNERPFLFDGLVPRYATRTIRSGMIRMRDGVELSTDFHVPLGAKLPLPVILTRTPYGKRDTWLTLQALFPEQGFIYAIQDVRGRHESGGEFLACTGQDREDGADTLDWLVAQAWCNGSVGAIGSSYTGETSAKLAATRHPALKSAFIMFDAAYQGPMVMNGGYLQGGAVMLRMLFAWFRDYVPKLSYGPPAWVDRQAWFRSKQSQAFATQPVKQPPVDMEAQIRTLPVHDMLDRTGAAPSDFAEMMRKSNDPTDPYWAAQGFVTEADSFAAPALHVTGPQEVGGSGARLFDLMRRKAVTDVARDNQFLLFTPQPHSGHARASAHFTWGARDFGDTRFPYYKTMVDWFGHWLRGDRTGVAAWPRARFFVAGRNKWDAADSFPPNDVETQKLWLHPGGGLKPAPPAGASAPSRYRYDPADPTPSEPPEADKELVGVGYADQRYLESRGDVLVFDSGPLATPMEIVGALSLELFVDSSARDTDFAAVLCEGRPDGKVINITHGILSMRHRNGLDRTDWMTPGRIEKVALDLWFASIEVPAGNSIRLHIQSAQFPAFTRNLNTGGDNFTGTQWVVADNGVHHSAAHPSCLTLPVRRRR